MIRALALVALLLAEPAIAAERLTVTSQYGPGKPQTLFWEHFAEELEAARPGVYDVTIVTGGALGGEKDEAEAVRLGSITGTLSTVANLTTWVPLGAALDLPFVFADRDHIMRVLDGAFGDMLKEAYREEGFVVPAFIIFGARHVLSAEPIETPADLAGQTMRALPSDLHIALWRALGANPTALPITEVYGALANGVVEAMDLTKSGYEALKLYEVAPYLSETAHIWAIGVVYFNAAFWDELGAEDRALFARLSRNAAAYFNNLTEKEADAALARTVQMGAKSIAVDQAVWRAALGSFAEDYASGMTDPRAGEAIEAIEAAR
ncbi:MAG: TRAP transporter substrate-binding protein [Acuticoccus sp.]